MDILLMLNDICLIRCGSNYCPRLPPTHAVGPECCPLPAGDRRRVGVVDIVYMTTGPYKLRCDGVVVDEFIETF